MATKIKTEEGLLKEILMEIKELREDVRLFIPSESLVEYAHADRIKRSYKEALKKYPRS